MTSRKIRFFSRKIRLWKLLVVVFLIAGGLVSLEYFRFQGLKNTLIELVDEKTNGAFALVIEDSNIDYLDLSVTFFDSYIESTSGSDVNGFERIEIPELYIDFGSLFSLLNKKQIVIEDFHVSEPIIHLVVDKTQTVIREEEEPLNIAHEITRLFPFVEEVLNQFDIESFEIRRADLSIRRKMDNSDVEVGLISLLISNWNMLDLSDQASLRFILEEQKIDIRRSHVQFDKIIYDYQDNLLRFENFGIRQYDTLGRLSFEMRNADLAIRQLDFEALYRDQEYILEEIRVDSAEMKAHLYAGITSVAESGKPRYPISRLLKQNLGELVVKRGGIFDCGLNLQVHIREDTVELALPRITVKFEEFGVTADSATVMFEDLTLDAHEAVFELDEDFKFKFKRLFYDDGRDMHIDSVELKHASADYDVIACEKISLYNFSIFDYLFDKDLKADSLRLRNGNIVFVEPPSEIRPISTPRVGVRNTRPMTIHLDKIIFDNIDLLYNYEAQRFHVSAINGVTTDYIKEGATTYQLEYFSSGRATFRDSELDMRAEIKNFYFQPRSLRLGSLTGRFQTLNFSFTDLQAAPENFTLNRPFYYSWNELTIGSTKLSGSMPGPKKGDQKGAQSRPDLKIRRTTLGNVDINLSGSDHTYALQGKDILLSRFGLSDGAVEVPRSKGRFDRIVFKNDEIDLTVQDAIIDNQGISRIDQIALTTEQVKGMLTDIAIGPWNYSPEGIDFAHASFNDFSVTQRASGELSTIDSITLDTFAWKAGEDPSLDKLNVFHPVFRWKTQPEKPQRTGTSDSLISDRPTPFRWLRELVVYQGKVVIDDKEVDVDKIDIKRENEGLRVSLDEISFATSKSSITLGKVYTTQKDIHLDGLKVTPKPEYLRNIELETDVFDGGISSIVLQEIQWDSLFNHNVLHADQVSIDGIDFIVSRDKRLPDPPAVEKPFLFSQLIPEIPGVYLPTIKVSNGNITYRETSDKTGQQGQVTINDINGTLHRRKPVTAAEDVLTATAKLYDTAFFAVNYDRINEEKFSLQVQLLKLPAPMLNQMVDPLEAVRLKSGMIEEFDLSVFGTNEKATGTALITYNDLHVEIFKKASPDVKNFGSGLLTLLADGIILRHSKQNAVGPVEQIRIKEKGPINYWVKSATFGALSAVRKGKSQKVKKKKRRRNKKN